MRREIVVLCSLLAGCAATGAPVQSGKKTEAQAGKAAVEADAEDTAGTRMLVRQPAGAVPGARPASDRDRYKQALSRAYDSFQGVNEGKNADYIPALAEVDPKLYGIVLVTVDGTVYEVGDARHEFSIQSVSKPFTLARAVEQSGADAVEGRIGVNATGMPFNSIIAIEMNKEIHPAGNPLVNAGAITTVDFLKAPNANTKWQTILETYSAFAGRPLEVNQEVYRSETETNTRNQAISRLLQAYEVVKGDPSEALDLYTRQCSVNVSARDLAMMGATLANGGKNPITGQQVVSPETVRHVLAVMATAGLYETTGKWLYTVGVPAKSGVGGGIVAVVPGRFAIGTFAPPLDEAGNSVRGQRAIESIVKRLGAGLFVSRPLEKTQMGASAPAKPAPVSQKGEAPEAR